MKNLSLPVSIISYSPQGWKEQQLSVITETTVGLTVNAEFWLSFSCTPVDLEALAAGFLFTEGIIESKEEISSLNRCANNSNIDVWINRKVERPAHWNQTSGCAGGKTQRTGDTLPKRVYAQSIFSPEVLFTLLNQLYHSQLIYQETRGVHCSALSDGTDLKYIAEDIGRHNTLDKLAGQLLLNPQPIEPHIILTTGRVSSEMLLKSARMKAEVVVSRTSPTSLSVNLANRLGITLVGYATHSQLLIYSHPDRLNLPEELRAKTPPVYLH